MKITIAERLHPFSHEVGTKFLLPRTSWSVQVFPTRLYFSDLEGKGESFYLELDFVGPIKEFTAEMDLEQGSLSVFGKTRQGYLRYQIDSRDNGIFLTMEKTPLDNVICHRLSEEFSLQKGEPHLLLKTEGGVAKTRERLSLGMHKAQDWDLIRRRLDCKEIFPHWFALSRFSPSTEDNSKVREGNFSLLRACEEKIEQRDRVGVLEAFENLFLAAFEGILVPRLYDSEYQGIEITKAAIKPNSSAMPLLVKSGRLIRSLFIREDKGDVWILPCLPSQFHAGRMIGVCTSQNECLNFEWTKKDLRRVEIESASNKEMRLRLPKGIRSLRLASKEGAKTVDVDSEGRAVLSLEAGKTMQLDRFEH